MHSDYLSENVRTLVENAVALALACGIKVCVDDLERLIRTAPRNDRDLADAEAKSWCMKLLLKAHDSGLDVEKLGDYFIDRLPKFSKDARKLLEETACAALRGMAAMFSSAGRRKKAA